MLTLAKAWSSGRFGQALAVHRIAMLLENNPYPSDVRVRREAESLAAVGHRVVVAAPSGPRGGVREVCSEQIKRRHRRR